MHIKLCIINYFSTIIFLNIVFHSWAFLPVTASLYTSYTVYCKLRLLLTGHNPHAVSWNLLHILISCSSCIYLWTHASVWLSIFEKYRIIIIIIIIITRSIRECLHIFSTINDNVLISLGFIKFNPQIHVHVSLLHMRLHVRLSWFSSCLL